MPEEFLDGPDVVTVLKEMGPERMSKCMTARRLGEPSFLDRLLHRFLEDGLMEVVLLFEAGTRIDVQFRPTLRGRVHLFRLAAQYFYLRR